MARKPSDLIHIELDFSTMDDEKRQALAASIVANAPKSAVYGKVAAIQTLVTALPGVIDALAEASALVAATRGLLATREAEEVDARADVDKNVLATKALVETNAASVADAQACGFKTRAKVPRSTTPSVPLGVKHVRRKATGQATVAAIPARPQDRTFAGRVSVGPITPTSWEPLPGSGKERTVDTYPSGTLLWFSFATTRGQLQSAWRTPVAVTVP